ncbi:MAG: hypothetical protein E6K92_05125 [Thaumarchaeota archaeon]|nr:MAG: hypothetical protein E6K92_05125 [Nitrososphaerota archaeon]
MDQKNQAKDVPLQLPSYWHSKTKRLKHFSWISEVSSLYISSFVNAHVINAQHRDEGAAERTRRQIVRGFWDRLTSGPELKYVLDSIRDPVPHQK